MTRTTLVYFSFFVAGAAALSTVAVAAEYVWWEGEQPSHTNFPQESDFAADKITKRNLLSGGDWLSASGKRNGPELFARYPILVPEDGPHTLWVRKFWRHGPFRWRIGDGPWQTCDRDSGLADQTPLGPHLSANWVCAGSATLSAGKAILELRLLASQGEEVVAGIDCFVLTNKLFVPNAQFKPGQRTGLAADGFFAYEPPADPFTESPIDLRRLNEPIAGQSGFLRKDGEQFILGDGRPVRFWAVTFGANEILLDHASIDYLARRLAKLGVNMVRFHSPLWDADPAGDVAKLNARHLDALHYMISAMKRQGIYTKLSCYFPVWAKLHTSFGIDGYESFENKQPFALLFFDPRMQELYKGWMRELLTTPNPYDDAQLPPGRDPAVGIVEIVNEDSFFFWTFAKNKIPPMPWRKLEGMFTSWIVAKHGSINRALDAWDDESAEGDSDVHLALFEAAHMTGKVLNGASAGKRRRAGDQAQFLAELQRGFYSEMTRYFKEDLGFGGLVSASNWVTADARLLGAVERWTYTAGDVIDRHGYFEPKHDGEGREWSVRVGHTFTSRAGVRNPERLPLQFQQVRGYPQIISELGWPNPNRFRADATFLTSAYGSLQGIDGLFHFAIDSSFLRDTAMTKFSVSAPVVSATFPAAALQYRRGDVAPAEPVLEQSLNLRDLFAMKGTAAATDDALDEFRKKDIPPGGLAEGPVSSFDPLSFYVGPFFVDFDGQPGRSKQRDLSSLIDREKKTLRSLTGELIWDYGAGIARVNTPKSQGAAGFLSAAGAIALDDVVVRCGNEFASVMVIALDDLPLRESKSMLVQVMTEERPYGFRTDGDRITDLGSGPFGIRKIDVAIVLRAPRGPVTIQAMDENGYVRSEETVAEGSKIQLKPDALYHVITRAH